MNLQGPCLLHIHQITHLPSDVYFRIRDLIAVRIEPGSHGVLHGSACGLHSAAAARVACR